ncbi:ABC transporter permease subunit [Haladaptatus sp. CMSO5]|uniref:ABC transporter permease subunit n=1 Tax=Haladaptatus sp. CMSO5 TaxID=3120514 RepID=UPI002FCDF20B
MSDETTNLDETDGLAHGETLLQVFERFEGPHTIGSSTRFWAGFWALTALAFIYPFTTNEYAVLTTTVLFVWVFLALSLSVIWGYSGIFSFGQTAFFGIGGYSFGVIGINLLPVTGGTNLALLVAIVFPALVAAVIGYFMFYGRVSGVYVAIITLATTLILELLFSRTAGQQYAIGEAQLGGYNGMTGIPSIVLGAGSATIELGANGMYFFVLTLFVLTYLALRYVLNSNYGYVMVATRESEDRTEMFGYDIRLLKLQVFTAAGGLAGLGGALYASAGNFISPPVMGLAFAALPVIWITVGGRTTLIGAIVGTLGLRFFSNELAAAGSEYATIFLGVVLLVAVLLLPDGVVPTIQRYWERRAQNPEGDQ